ncbi:DUF294 nucleotidyltransferase-like domain-containing protein [Roseivivax sp. CAU 1761]
MTQDRTAIGDFLTTLAPFAALPAETRAALVEAVLPRRVAAGDRVYAVGAPLDGLHLVMRGEIEVRDEHGVPVSVLGPHAIFGERGLARDGRAATTATALSDTRLLILPAATFRELMASEPEIRRFFERERRIRPARPDLVATRAETLMSRRLVTAPPGVSVRDAAIRMREAGASSICVTEGERLVGLVTQRDLAGRIVAEGRPAETPLAEVMTRDPVTLPPSALGSDVLKLMLERGIGHVPVAEQGRLLGMITQTDLTRWQASRPADLAAEIGGAESAGDIARVTARIPQMLAQLVASGQRHEVTTRLVTDIADAATRRLVTLAEARLGPAPCRWLWLACGSQGRQEQSGITDQDNCLILEDGAGAAEQAYFAEFAGFVCDGLNAAGYVYCPGDMMAKTPRWCQPLSVWRGYFRDWIAHPRPEAQMLASVMFDLRPIAGDVGLFADLHEETLERARSNSIFRAHMTANALKHTPPLGLFRGFALIRSGEHRRMIDLKHSGVVPVIDLARLYALEGTLLLANTRAWLEVTRAAGIVSQSGGQDLLDAYDLIAETRLAHQCRQVGDGVPPDNFLAPPDLSDFDRAHLRDAFVVVKGMQSAVGQGRHLLG